jgi:flagellar basal-body rod protein FlgF
MDNATYVALSGQVALRRKLEIVANNIANINTPGYKREQARFDEVFAKLEADGKGVAFVHDKASVVDTEQGAMSLTGGDLDVGLNGDGVLSAQAGNGEKLYTRDGRMSRNAEGGLIMTATGLPMLDEGGAPITIPPDVAKINISPDGVISSARGNRIAKLGIFSLDFTNADRVADGLYRPSAGKEPEPDTETRTIQGFVENSNVNAVRELTDLIAVQRAYETAKNMADREDERIKKAISALSRLA